MVACWCLCFNSVKLILLYHLAGIMADEAQNDVNDQVADVSFSVSYLLSPSTHIFIQNFLIWLIFSFFIFFFFTSIPQSFFKTVEYFFLYSYASLIVNWEGLL